MHSQTQSLIKKKNGKGETKTLRSKSNAKFSCYDKGIKNYKEYILKTFHLPSHDIQTKCQSAVKAVHKLFEVPEHRNSNDERNSFFTKDICYKQKDPEHRVIRSQSNQCMRNSASNFNVNMCQ